MRRKVKRVEKKDTKRTEETKEAPTVECEEHKDDTAPTHLPEPQRTVSMPTPVAHPPAPRSPPTPQLAPSLPAPARWSVASPSPPPPPPAAATSIVPHFGPLDDSAAHPPIRMAMRGRSAGSIMLVVAGGDRAEEADRADDAINGRRGGMPVSHHRDWASLTAIQHISAVTVKLSNGG